MKWMRRIIATMTLGFITSVAIAIAMAAKGPVSIAHRDWIAFVHGNRPWALHIGRDAGTTDIWWMDLHLQYPDKPTEELVTALQTQELTARRAEQRAPELLPRPAWGSFASDPLATDVFAGSDTAFGWPRLCLWYQIISKTDDTTMNTSHELHGGVLMRGKLASRGGKFIALPLRPIWRGLAIDTAFYAAVWWLVLFIPMMLRRGTRRARGRCLDCGYDLQHKAQQGCPECGWNRPA